MVEEQLSLPGHYEIEQELREQLSGRAGHQRCVVGQGELLLILHEVPEAGVPERQALIFWKQDDGAWLQTSGSGLSELGALLDRYTRAIDQNEEKLQDADEIKDVFEVLRHARPMYRSLRNLNQGLEQTLVQEPDDRQIRGYRDRARELERAAELLVADAGETLTFRQAEISEEHTEAADRLGKILFKLNLVAGFFLPLVALGGLLGMNIKLPRFVDGLFWVILFGGLLVGAVLVVFVSRGLYKKD